MIYAQYLSESLANIVPGLVGASIYLVLRKPPSPHVAVGQLAAGVAVGLYGAPAVVEYLHRSSAALDHAVGFALGVAGPMLVGIMIRVLERRGDAIADRFVDRVAGSKKGERK